MQALLESLNSVPGVVGGMVCASEGRVVARAFPAPFDDVSLQDAAAVLADGCVGLGTVAGSLGLVDLRYAEARIVVKPMTGGLLLLLCGKDVNLQLLLISVAVAGRKIEKALAEESVPPPAAEDERPRESHKAKGKSKWWPSV
jgi:predicted regulator of Ras-like GTPase activity (Roadblock/LC7/MglB family)